MYYFWGKTDILTGEIGDIRKNIGSLDNSERVL